MAEQLKSVLVMLLVAAAHAAAAVAQTGSSGIAGLVKDASGAVLPGVTVEVSSPALIERVRTVVTDGEGLYRILDLRPGAYTVTFSLTGFSTVKREGIELPASFTATVNADLKVGSLEETITVSGQSPVVDVQNAAPRSRLPSDLLNALPTNKTLEAFIALTPGLSAAATAQDVGGSKGETYVTPSIHGSHGLEARTVLDGFETNNPDNGGGGRVFIPNPASTQEVSMGLGGGTAESQTSGVAINFLPRDGGNTFRGSFFANFTNDALQSAPRLSDQLRARNLTQAALPVVKYVWDVNGGLGGPIQRDRLWFFTAHRSWGSANSVVGQFGNQEPAGSWFYTPNRSDPAVNDFVQQSDNVRITWQVSARNKINASYDYEYRCDCHRDVSATSSPEASRVRLYYPQIISLTWNFPVSNRLLLEAGTLTAYLPIDSKTHDGQTEDTIPVVESSTNLAYRASTAGYGRSFSAIQNSRVSASYVTGRHAVKVGFEMRNPQKDYETRGSAISYTFRNRVPTQVTLNAYPLDAKAAGVALALYAQDQWTFKRLTLSPGVRMDYLNAWVPAVHLDSGPYVPARDFPDVKCVPCWNDVTARLSAAYDLFGNGKTAVKGSVGRYLGAELLNLADSNNPQNVSNPSAVRAWTDANGDFIPQESELGPLSNANFGKTVVTTRYGDDVLRRNRPYNWQASASIQHELRSGLAVNVGYFWTSWHNFRATQNLDVTPQDYDPYCLTFPIDARLPGGGGNQLCGLYDINPAKFGQTNHLLVTQASNFGTQKEIYNGLDLTFTGRLPRGVFLHGGVSTGRTETDRCFVVDSPQALRFCHVTPPFWQPQLKLSVSYPLVWNLQVSGVFQSLPGIPISASYVATTADVRPSLGRNLSGNASTVTISDSAAALGTAPAPGFSFPSPGVIAPQTLFESRSSQLDLRLTRNFRVAGMRLQGMFDIYNALNASPILAINTRYGPAWLTPTFVLDARLFKFGVQVEF